MKKTLSLLMFAGMLSVTACGPTAEEKAKEEEAKQAKLDSIRQASSQPSLEVTDSSVAPAAEEAPATEEAHH